eukprot:6212484-Pleurochrysis_carterae.AAC.2
MHLQLNNLHSVTALCAGTVAMTPCSLVGRGHASINYSGFSDSIESLKALCRCKLDPPVLRKCTLLFDTVATLYELVCQSSMSTIRHPPAKHRYLFWRAEKNYPLGILLGPCASLHGFEGRSGELTWSRQRMRTAREHALTYVLDLNGLVYRLTKYGPRVLVPRQRCFAHVHACHRLLETVGHRGAAAMANRLRQPYYWEGLLTHCEQICQHCEVCRNKDTPSSGGAVATQVMKDPTFPFHTLSIDHKTITPPKGTIYQYILMIVDMLTRFVTAVPCVTASAAEETLSIPGIARLLVRHIQQFRNWPDTLPMVAFALNCTEYLSTGVSPFFALYLVVIPSLFRSWRILHWSS